MSFWIDGFFPADWYQDVTVERGGGGLDRWGNPLPVEKIEVKGCLLGRPTMGSDPERLGTWSDTDAVISHRSFVFEQNDIVVVPDDQRNAGRWEVQSPAHETTFGNEARVRRVNQRGVD